MQLNGVNYPIQRLILYYSVNRDTHPDTDKLLPISQSSIQIDFEFVFFKYSARVDFPEFFLPKMSKVLFEVITWESMFEKGALV